MQHRVYSASSADNNISFDCKYFCDSESIFISLSTWPPSPSTSTSLTPTLPTPWWRLTWSAWGAAPPPSSTWSGQSSAGAAQTAGTCRVSRVTINSSKIYRCRLKEILSELWKQVDGGVLERWNYIWHFQGSRNQFLLAGSRVECLA